MHPLRRARKTHNNRMLTQEKLADLTGLSKSTIERAERGEPVSGYTQQQLCSFFEKTAQELGLVSEACEDVEDMSSEPVQRQGVVATSFSQPMQRAVVLPTPSIVTRYQPMDTRMMVDEASPEQQLGAWLARGASDLAGLFDEGWTLENLLESLEVLLKGVQAMPNFARRRFLQLGAAAMVSGIPMPTSKHVSFEEKAQLSTALSESIVAGWKLFHTAGNAQVLAVGQAQLYLVQQCHSTLPSRDRSMFYTSVYNLIGKALYFQERHEASLEAHTNAHIAAMSTGNPWFVTQSLICQADCHQTLNQHAQAIEALEEALHIVGNPTEIGLIRTKAHLLACWADNAISLGEYSTAQRQLDASAAFLDQLEPSEEFDRATWLQLVGKYAFATGDYAKAIQHYEEALAALPPNWIIRQAFILIPMMVTYACMRDRSASLALADRAASVVNTLNAPSTNKQFVDAVRLALLGAFPGDEQVLKFTSDLKYKVPVLNVVSSLAS